MINRQKFYDIANKTIYGSKMSPSQKAGIEMVLDEWEKKKLTDDRMLAYMLGTDYHETNATMQPVIEAYWLSEEWRRLHLRYYPFYGRGLPQLTWEVNYREMTNLLKEKFKRIPDFDLVKHPEQALIPEVAVAVMFEGMLRADSNFGDYTGKALEDYFGPNKADWIGARYVVNGQDKAAEIADVSQRFLAALRGDSKLPARVLNYGMKGEDVEVLQMALSSRGYLPRDQVDGDFGPATKAAVIAFQRSAGLTADGVAGPATKKALAIV